MKKTLPVQKLNHPLNRQRWLLGLWGAFALAVLWRLIAAYEVSRGRFAVSMFMPSEATDLRTYMELSKSIVDGTFSGPFYYQPFYYAVFLPLCRLVFGSSVWGVVAVQAVLGGFTALLSGLLAARAAGKIAGIAAAYLTALCTVLVFYVPFHQIATLQAFNLTLISYLAVRSCQSCKLRYAAYLGVASAIGCLTRGNVLLVFLPLLLIEFIVYYRRCGWKKSILAALFTLIMFGLVELPFIAYNTIQLGHLSGPSTAADAVLALGNTPEAPPGGRNPGLPAGPMEYPQAYHVWMQDCETVPVWKKIVKYIFDEPGAYLELTYRKLLLFWDAREIPNNVSLTGEGSSIGVLKLTIPVGIVLALGLGGIFLSLKKIRKSSYLLLLTVVVFYWGATAVFYNLSRFRAPLLPVIAVWGGICIAILYGKSRSGQWKYIRTYGFLALAVGAFITVGVYEFYRTVLEKHVLKTVRPSGTVLQLPDSRSVQFYHGPMTFGGWQVLETPAGTLLSVKFPNSAAKSTLPSEVRFSVQSSRQGVLVLDVEGAAVSSVFKSPEFKEITVQLPENFKSNVVNVKVIHNSADAGFIADFQRDYGASTLNGRTLPAELVMRITR